MVKQQMIRRATFCIFALTFSFHFSLAQSVKPKLLYIGDSHSVENFGPEFERKLSETYIVSRVAASGASTDSYLEDPQPNKKITIKDDIKFCYESKWHVWKGFSNPDPSKYFYRTPCLSSLFEIMKNSKNEPDIFVIALGANQLQSKVEDLEKFISKLPKDKPCVWVGPPTAPRGQPLKESNKITEKFYDTFSKITDNHCRIFKSNLVTEYPEFGEIPRGEHFVPDGRHFKPNIKEYFFPNYRRKDPAKWYNQQIKKWSDEAAAFVLNKSQYN